MYFLVSVSCFAALACLCVFLVDNLLRLDSHVHHVGGFGLKTTVCNTLASCGHE